MDETHWHYFLALEEDFFKTTRFVELDAKNHSTFSIEFAKLLLSTGSEIDVICKQLGSRAGSIDKYRTIITKSFPKFPSVGVASSRSKTRIYPWSSWSKEESPDWWRAYNDVKHHRSRKYEVQTRKM